MEIVLVRHAQPDWEPDGRAVDDPGLTDFGHAQARLAAEALAGEHFDHVYVSPLQRVVETAAPICEALGKAPLVRPWLREIGLPSLAGRSTEQVQQFFAEAQAREIHHWAHGMPGGESFTHFYERVAGGIESLLDESHRVSVEVHEASGWRLWDTPDPDDADRLLIVAHEGTNAAILSHLLGIEAVPWTWMRFSGAWTGIHRIHTVRTGSGRFWSLQVFNDVRHLAPLEIDTSNGRSSNT